jgi:hypothetical protein
MPAESTPTGVVNQSTTLRILAALDWFEPAYTDGPVEDWDVDLLRGGDTKLRTLITDIDNAQWRELGLLAEAKGRAANDLALQRIGRVLADPGDFASLFLAMQVARQYKTLLDLRSALETA